MKPACVPFSHLSLGNAAALIMMLLQTSHLFMDTQVANGCLERAVNDLAIHYCRLQHPPKKERAAAAAEYQCVCVCVSAIYL